MHSSLHLFHRIENMLSEFLPPLYKRRLDNLAWMIVGIHQAQHVHLSKIADHRPGAATLESKTHQFRRFVANEALDARAYYEPLARQLLQQAAEADAHGRLRLLLDALELPGRRKILMLALAYRRRALPILWQVWRGKGATGAQVQMDLLDHLWDLVPEHAHPIVVADGEFSSVELMKHLDGNGWGYRLRLSMDTQVHLPDGTIRSLAELAPKPGERRYLQRVYLTALHAYGPMNVALYWQPGEDKPWCIATDEEAASYQTLSVYSRRMWVEQLFGDLEGGGFHLDQSRLYEPERLSRLLLAVCLAYVWLMYVGASVVKRGLRRLVGRAERRDRSLVEIGRHWIRRRLTNGEPLQTGLVPYF